MSFRVSYQLSQDEYGHLLRSVLLNVILSRDDKRRVSVQAIVDSGAVRCVFDSRLGKMLGLDVESGRPLLSQGIGGIVPMWLHDVTLHLPGRTVMISAGFQHGLPVAGLLGMNGFFEQYRVCFNDAGKYCEFSESR